MTHGEGLHVLSLSIHGLVRGFDIELGRDADTGGQITFVIEQAKAMAAHPGIDRVDLVTRQIFDRKVDPSYAEVTESLGENVRIVRFPFGPRRYLHKERLWPHVHSLVDNILHEVREHGRGPDIIHGHYADAGYVGAQLSDLLGVPFVFTGHSLGRVKKARLMEKGATEEALEKQYNFQVRIEAEERALETAVLVMTSTHQEVEEQYALYDHYDPGRMEVIPPGVDLSRFHPPGERDKPPRFGAELARFLRDPRKPMIVAMARADERKNFPALLHAFGRSSELRERANLVLVAGNRDEIGGLPASSRRVMVKILELIDRYDLYGSVAYPKHHTATDVPELYRMAARTRGVFVNPALTEPFGLTLIEAAASGLPIVATHDGGPRDIVAACENGLLVDPLDPKAIGDAVLHVIEDPRRWETWSKNGVQGAHRVFSWSSHVDRYLGELDRVLEGSRPGYDLLQLQRSRLPTIDRLLITDVDNTLTGDDKGLRTLLERLRDEGDRVGFAIATGRTPEQAVEALKEAGAPAPDILITSVGTEILYGERLTLDRSWQRHIDYQWRPGEIRAALRELDGLKLQNPENQRRFKISYDVDPDLAPAPEVIHRHLRKRGLRARVVYSLQAYLDVLPIRATAGQAIRFLAFKWNLSPDHMLVAGDSGNDEDMLSGNTLGVVVGNYSPELEHLKGHPRIYFARGHHAWGILEGAEHYEFFEKIRVPEEETLA